MTQAKAYEFLISQPTSVSTCTSELRNNIVISAVADLQGKPIIISCYGDDLWDMWPFFDQSNLSDSGKSFSWLKIPKGFRHACKAIIYRYWRVGIPGSKRPAAVSLMRVLSSLVVFTEYLARQGLSCLSDTKPIHVSNYVHEQREVKRLLPNTLVKNFLPLEILYRFRDEYEDRLGFHPWPDSSYFDIAGMPGDSRLKSVRTSKTPLIPKPVAKTLFNYAENIFIDGDRILNERDTNPSGELITSEAKLLRDSCFFLIGTLTGMRCEEITGIEAHAGRTELKDGNSYHWVKSIEHKTFKGKVEYLMPSMVHDILKTMERLSAPLRENLKDQIAIIESLPDAATCPLLQKRLAQAKADKNRLFLGMHKGRIRTISGNTWQKRLKNLSSNAGTDWPLAPHQMRRLYAWTFVRHRLGNLLFLKEQFKHSSIDMSQLYAANPNQDSALYEEIFEEIQSQKIDIIDSWLSDDQPLAGGAGVKIMKMRAHDFANRGALICETSIRLSLRSTGHGWCLAQDDDCGGQGLYEKSLCVDCGNSIIDQSFKVVWQELYSHQNELLQDAEDLGPGAVERVRRDMSRAKRVLNTLGGDIT